jgi:hypothetical protein
MVSEWNSCHPLWRNDALVMMGAYSGLQNWSALQYALGGAPFGEADQAKAKLDNVFELAFQGGTLGLWPAVSTMVLRRDVKEANREVYRPLGHREVFDPASRVGLPEGLPFVAKTGMVFVGDKTVKPEYDPFLSDYVRSGTARSVTGELFTDWSNGIFTVDTPRTQAIVGFLQKTPKGVSNLWVDLSNEFVTVMATSIDGAPISQSKRVLLTAVGNTINSGMEIAPSGTSFKQGGHAPILIEPMVGKVKLSKLQGTLGKPVVYYLNASGTRMGQVPVNADGDSVSFIMAPSYKAMHYELVR